MVETVFETIILTAVTLFFGRFAGELVADPSMTFLDYFGRSRVLGWLKDGGLVKGLLGCSSCVAFWARLPVIAAGSITLSETDLQALTAAAVAVLGSYELDRQWAFKERVTGRMNENTREL